MKIKDRMHFIIMLSSKIKSDSYFDDLVTYQRINQIVEIVNDMDLIEGIEFDDKDVKQALQCM